MLAPQVAGKAAAKVDAAASLLPKDAAYVGIGALLILLIFYTFHCVWVRLLNPQPLPGRRQNPVS